MRERFAYTLLDCPPSLGPVTVNALVAADKVIVPVQAEYLALEGLVQFLDTLKLVRRELNPDLTMAGVVITMQDERTRLGQDVERELREHLPAKVFKTVIPRSIRVAEAPSYGIPVAEHDPSSPGAQGLPGARRGGGLEWPSVSAAWAGAWRRSCPESGAGGPELRELPIAQIEPNPDQPRKHFEKGAARRPRRVDRLGRESCSR